MLLLPRVNFESQVFSTIKNLLKTHRMQKMSSQKEMEIKKTDAAGHQFDNYVSNSISTMLMI